MKALKEILVVDKDKWAKEAEEIEGYYNGTIKDRIPEELWNCLETLKANCKQSAEEKPAAPKAAKTVKKTEN